MSQMRLRPQTLSHVLNHCGPYSPTRQRRHNKLQGRLVKVASSSPWTVKVVHDDVNHLITIAVVAMPFEDHVDSFDGANQEIKAEYASLANRVTDSGFSVTVEAFIVGALGAWTSRNKQVLSLLHISQYYAVLTRRLMVIDAIRWSRGIYVVLYM
ncbi:hypothetical protein TSAR_013993 [Trichomalopsis sarcophagae]|uniref:Uncharacterized protein n=1 Tax=Trichomalopsis sarcophagae TaxID=543379 RepID=A0A232EKR0_9HYME|nr:hypothetical protein TSAR_013993 [Trichomalopsis sarcophagae]